MNADNSQIYEPVVDYDAAQKKFVVRPINLGSEAEQVFLILYGTGIRSRSSLSDVIVTISGINTEVLFAGAQGDLVGLDQINVKIPRNLAGREDVDVILTVTGKAANTVRVQIQ